MAETTGIKTNDHLIAAAPELLTVVKALLQADYEWTAVSLLVGDDVISKAIELVGKVDPEWEPGDALREESNPDIMP